MQHDKTLERNFLATVLFTTETGPEGDPRSPYWKTSTLTPKHFWLEPHRRIWRAIQDCAQEHGHVWPGGVTSNLGDEFYERIEDGFTLETLDQYAAPSASVALNMRDKLVNLYELRRAQQTANQVAGGIDAGDYSLEDAHDAFSGVLRPSTATALGYSAAELSDEFVERLTRKESESNFSTGSQPVDHALHGGLRLGRYYIVAGRPKQGKTKLVVSWVHNLVENENFTVDYWYTDGTRSDIFREFLACEVQKSTKVLAGAEDSADGLAQLDRYDDSVRQRVMGAIDHFKTHWNDRLRIYQVGNPRPADILAQARARASQADGPYAVIVDYVQNCDAGHSGRNGERLNTAATSRMLARARSELNCIAIGLSQFNRNAEDRDEPKPHDLKSSGQLEQDVNHLCIWHRPHFGKDDASDDDKKLGTFNHALSKHEKERSVSVHAELGYNSFTTHKGGF